MYEISSLIYKGLGCISKINQICIEKENKMITGLLIFVVDWWLIGFFIWLFQLYTIYLDSEYFVNEGFIDYCIMILVSPFIFSLIGFGIVREWIALYNTL